MMAAGQAGSMPASLLGLHACLAVVMRQCSDAAGAKSCTAYCATESVVSHSVCLDFVMSNAGSRAGGRRRHQRQPLGRRAAGSRSGRQQRSHLQARQISPGRQHGQAAPRNIK